MLVAVTLAVLVVVEVLAVVVVVSADTAAVGGVRTGC